jgi:hypothetical protein
MASGLIVVGPDTGILWGLDCAEPVALCGGAATAWVDFRANAVRLDWKFLAWPAVIAEALTRAWALRTHFTAPNQHALQWLSYDVFAKKWVEALSTAMPSLGIEAAPPKPPPPHPRPASTKPQPPRKQGRTIIGQRGESAHRENGYARGARHG